MADLVMPFFNPLQVGLADLCNVVGADENLQVKIVAQRRVALVEYLFVFVFVVIPKGRDITEHGRSGGEGSGTFSFEEMPVGKCAFRDQGVEFIFYLV